MRESRRHDFGAKMMREATRWKVDEWLSSRATWMLDQADVVRELLPKVRFEGSEPVGPTVVFVGAGKGHEIEGAERLIPGAKFIGLDPHDYFAPPVEERLKEVGADVVYLHESVRGEDLKEIPDHSADGLTLFFVLHHVEAESLDALMVELRRVMKSDGRIFVAEDIVDNDDELAVTTRADRLINVELSEGPHNYRSLDQWNEYFNHHGFEVIREHEVRPGKVRHGFFVLRPKISPSNL